MQRYFYRLRGRVAMLNASTPGKNWMRMGMQQCQDNQFVGLWLGACAMMRMGESGRVFDECLL